MRVALCLAASVLLGIAPSLDSNPAMAGQAAQDAEPPSLADLEADYMVLMSEADELGRGRTIDQSIRFSTTRQGTLRVQIDEMSALLRRRGVTNQELFAARERFAAGEDVGVFEDLAGEAGEEIATNIAEAGLSEAAKRTLFGLGLLLDGAQAGAERYVRYANSSDALELLQQGAVQHRQIADMIAVMNAELVAEIRAKQRLEQILPEQRRLFGQIAEERRRRGLTAGPATQYASSAEREADALGDEALTLASIAEGVSRPGPITGTYDTSYGRMVLGSSGGTYTDSDGRIVFTSVTGSVMQGYWVQARSSRECPQSRYGRHYGRVRFTFTTEGFTGVWNYCDDEMTRSWNGTRSP